MGKALTSIIGIIFFFCYIHVVALIGVCYNIIYIKIPTLLLYMYVLYIPKWRMWLDKYTNTASFVYNVQGALIKCKGRIVI